MATLFGSSGSSKKTGGTALFGGASLGSDEEDNNPYSAASIQKQIGNAEIRVNDAGFNPEENNKRNWFEKATNLPVGQNAFLDTLDIMTRGGNAVKNVIDKTFMKDTEDVGTALYRGLSGRERVSGADLMKRAGDDSKIRQFGGGLLADIALDPLTYVPGGLIAKGIGTVAKPIAGAAKSAYGALESASPALKTFREAKVEPIADSIKDGMGHIFKPQYKWEETLTGGKDDTLKTLFGQTNNDIKYMNEESMKSVSEIAKSTGIDAGDDVGRLMEKDIVMHGPRPARQLSTDPSVTKAADDLVKSNDTLRQWALDNEIPVGELDGYMKHILSAEEKAFRQTRKGKLIDTPRSGMNNPDKKILNARKYQGSVEDINDQFGKKFFEPNAYFSTAIGQKKLIEYGNAVKFRREILSNPNFSTKYTGGTPVPGTEVINTNNYKFMKDPNGVLPDEVGGEYLVTKGVKESLDRYQRLTTDEGSKAFLKAYDTVQSTWKRFALFSPGYHVRNLAGAMFNNSIGGMSTVDLAKYTPQGFKEVLSSIKGKESALFNEYRRQGLSSSSLSKVEFAKAGEAPEESVRKTVESLSKNTKGKVLERVNPLNAFKTSQELGDFMDQTNRFALYKWARENKGMSPEAAAAKVREVQFDYSRLTPVEQSTIARLVPFYRWMKNNIPFQIKSFINDPRKYANVDKLRQEAQQATGLNDENMPDYMKEQFNIPVYGKNGVGKSLGLNLPLTDLMKLTDPLKTVTDSLSPAIKAPLELASNYNMFYKKPIQKFEGQEKQFSLGGVNLGGIPIKAAYALEQATGQIGRGLSEYLQKPDQKDNDTTFRVPSLGVSSILKPFDAEEAKRLEQLQKLKRLQDLMLYIEQQQGDKPRTVKEIKKSK